MIVVCPNCGARYRLSDAAIAKGGRLRCAACDHRWVPEAEVEAPVPVVAPRPPVPEHDEEAAFAAVQEQMRARWDTPAAASSVVNGLVGEAAAAPVASWAAVRDSEDAAEPEVFEARAAPWVLKTVAAVIAGAALMVAAAGLWIGQFGGIAGFDTAALPFDVHAVPAAAALLSRTAPVPALVVSVRGETNRLPSGKRVLEVMGSVRNDGKTVAVVPPLLATLSGPEGTALRWTIAVPARALPPGGEVGFASNVTGFPVGATTLAVRAGR